MFAFINQKVLFKYQKSSLLFENVKFWQIPLISIYSEGYIKER